MSIRGMLVLFLMIFFLFLEGCTTFYYKQFVIRGEPHYPDSWISARELSWIVKIDAEPTDRKTYGDSMYVVGVSVLREASEDCTDRLQALFESLELRRLDLRFGNEVVHAIDSLKQKDAHNGQKCWITWRFSSVRISDLIDTVNVNLSAFFKLNSRVEAFDTTVTMIRLTGKQIDVSD